MLAAECTQDLMAAEPIIAAAEAALDSLTKADLTELKAFSSPAQVILSSYKRLDWKAFGLDSLTNADLTEIKAFSSPAQVIDASYTRV